LRAGVEAVEVPVCNVGEDVVTGTWTIAAFEALLVGPAAPEGLAALASATLLPPPPPPQALRNVRPASARAARENFAGFKISSIRL
jgi:hypothetical protein